MAISTTVSIRIFSSQMANSPSNSNNTVLNIRKYQYSQSGLQHYYEKNNVPQKLDLEKKQEKEKVRGKEKRFLEYEYMENNEIIVTIEHCSNCEDHQTHTQHINDIYKTFAKVLQKCILLRYPFIKVYLKPIDTNIINNEGSDQIIIDNRYKEVRIGAMEVQLGVKVGEKTEIHMLHSKLSTGNWPSINTVLNKLVTHMPKFNIKGITYDKEEGLSTEEGEKKFEDIMLSKFENIKVNLYQLKSEQHGELVQFADEELGRILNPKKRKEFYMKQRTVEKENYYTSTNHNSEISNRPVTVRSSRYSQSKDFTSRASSAMTTSYRPLSTGRFRATSSKMTVRDNEFFEDRDKIAGLKGVVIRTTFTNAEGKFKLDDLPYDTYLLEVEDSKNFQSYAVVIKLSQYIENLNLNKIIGLRRQVNSHAEVYVYFNINSQDEFNMQLVSGCELILRRCSENIADNNFFDDNRKSTF
jgi:hypothetical protein